MSIKTKNINFREEKKEYIIYKNAIPKKIHMTYNEYFNKYIKRFPKVKEMIQDQYDTFNANAKYKFTRELEFYRNIK